MSSILALGDCNTLGTNDLKGHAYSELFAKKINKSVKNCGYGMSTTNEMVYFFQNFMNSETEIILVQYGIVDSWKTFKYSPYVLYYPDNIIRKIYRKIVKKYNKIAKNMGLNKLFGTKNVVDIVEYEKNIEAIIKQAKKCRVFLIDTIPNQETFRNSEIKLYNKILLKLANKYNHVEYVEIYNDFLDKPEYYLDNTHMTAEGFNVMTQKFVSLYNQYNDNNQENKK